MKKQQQDRLAFAPAASVAAILVLSAMAPVLAAPFGDMQLAQNVRCTPSIKVLRGLST
jgi:hypothetical protein